MSKSKGLIIVPAFNEENNIDATIKEIQESRTNFDILIIDDGSMDATAEARKREVHYAYSWFNNMTAEMFG